MSIVCHSAVLPVLRRASRVAALVAVLVVAGVNAPRAFAANEDEVIFPGGSAKSETASLPKTGGLNSFTLAAGMLLAGVGGWFVWRNRRNAAAGRTSSALAVEETRSLGNRQYLVVASYDGRKFLLGVCPGQINLIAPLDEASGEASVRE